MKNFVRAFALTLVAAGAFASAQINHTSGNVITSATVSAMPVPMCPPSDPNGCGMAQKGN